MTVDAKLLEMRFELRDVVRRGQVRDLWFGERGAAGDDGGADHQQLSTGHVGCTPAHGERSHGSRRSRGATGCGAASSARPSRGARRASAPMARCS